MDFGTIEHPELNALSLKMDERLRDYEGIFRGVVNFGDHRRLYLTPDKPNTARTEIPVLSNAGDSLGTLYSIAFLPGDGTGNNTNYRTENVIIPDYLKFDKKSEKVIPRVKDCRMELFFPFFSAKGKEAYNGFVSLEEWSLKRVEDTSHLYEMIKIADLGYREDAVDSVVHSKNSKGEYIQLTTGHTREGKRFGDPHSIIFRDREDNISDMIQVVGFWSIDKSLPPKVLEIIEHEAKLPKFVIV